MIKQIIFSVLVGAGKPPKHPPLKTMLNRPPEGELK